MTFFVTFNFFFLSYLSIFILFFAQYLWLCHDTFQFVFQCNNIISFNIFDGYYVYFALDSVSTTLILLTSFFFPICFLIHWQDFKNILLYSYLMFFIELLLLCIFSVLDIFFFYVFFEAILIPMFIIIGFYGTRERKIYASYLFFIYTLAGSILFLVALLFIYNYVGSFNYLILNYNSINVSLQKYLWIAFFVSFAVKTPLFPFHLWLPEAHVEAPTGGSVLLAGVLLKLGSYGFLRFVFQLLPNVQAFFFPFIASFCFISLIYSSFVTLRQTDMKKLIAYSSVAHMSYCILGLFCGGAYGLHGSILVMISHALISSSLFILIGFLYVHHRTKLIKYYTGLINVIPLFTFFFFIFSLSNLGFPFASSFPAELLILTAVIFKSLFFSMWVVLALFLATLYSMWLYSKISYANLNSSFLKHFLDLDRKHVFLLTIFLSLNLILGITPSFFINYHSSYVNFVLYYYYGDSINPDLERSVDAWIKEYEETGTFDPEIDCALCE